MYDSRNILRSLVTKNLFGNYKNSALGFLWHFMIPIIMMIVYYIVFTQIRTSDIPYFWIFISSALFPFNFMIVNITSGAGCIVSNSVLVKKMYFPRELIVFSQVLSSLIITVIGYLIVLVAVALSGYGFGWAILFVPVILIVEMVFVTGCTMVVSALTVYIRDVQYFLQSISMVFFFMTPMYFMSDSVSGLFKLVITINPFTYFVESYHYIVYFKELPPISYLLVCIMMSVTMLVIGALIFRKLKNGFAERL